MEVVGKIVALVAFTTSISGLVHQPNLNQQAKIEADIASLKDKYGVQIHYSYNTNDYFPKNWRKAPASARGKQISPAEATRILPIIDQFLSAYPPKVLDDNLDNIYLLSELEFFGKPFGGISSRSGIYITNKGRRKGHNTQFLLQLMHSEFSSILKRKYDFPEKKWEAANVAGFKYRGSGVEMLGESNLYQQTSRLLSQGFLYKYSQSSVENDFNMFVRLLLTDKNTLQQLARKHPRINAKMQLTVEFYNSIDDGFQLR